MKIFQKIQLKIVIFTAVKNRGMLHGHVFVMVTFASIDDSYQRICCALIEYMQFRT